MNFVANDQPVGIGQRFPREEQVILQAFRPCTFYKEREEFTLKLCIKFDLFHLSFVGGNFDAARCMVVTSN